MKRRYYKIRLLAIVVLVVVSLNYASVQLNTVKNPRTPSMSHARVGVFKGREFDKHLVRMQDGIAVESSGVGEAESGDGFQSHMMWLVQEFMMERLHGILVDELTALYVRQEVQWFTNFNRYGLTSEMNELERWLINFEAKTTYVQYNYHQGISCGFLVKNKYDSLVFRDDNIDLQGSNIWSMDLVPGVGTILAVLTISFIHEYARKKLAACRVRFRI